MLETATNPIDQLAESLGIAPEKLDEIGRGKGDAFEYLPAEIREVLPKLYSQQSIRDTRQRPNPLVILKYFLPGTGWTWYVTEGEPEGDDFTFFGFIVGLEPEFGYISLKELRGAKTRLGLRVERDLHFRPCRLHEIHELKGVLR
jgi:Protein of unknown function (DUF2958)